MVATGISSVPSEEKPLVITGDVKKTDELVPKTETVINDKKVCEAEDHLDSARPLNPPEEVKNIDE